MAQLRNANLAGVKLTPEERKQIVQRYAKYATRGDGSVDEELALRKYGQRQYRIKNNLALGKGNKQAAPRARRANALGDPSVDAAGVAYAAGQRRSNASTPQSSYFGPKPSWQMARLTPPKGGPAGGKPTVTEDKSTSKRRRAIRGLLAQYR